VLNTHITIYRIIVTLGCIISIALTLAIPVYFAEPDDWTYFFAVQNFSRGQFTVDNQTHLLQINEARSQGGQGIQYWNVSYNKWALEKAPGYVFYLVPFKLMGIPRGGNIILALGVVIITFLILKRLKDEKAAMIGTLLILFTPMSLVMLNRAYMDTYAAQAFLLIGGGLYIYYHLERNRWGPMKRGILLFLAFFLAGWSVITRYTDLPVVVVLVLHFIIVKAIAWRKGEKPGIKSDILPVALGIGLPAAAILLYDYFVFGSPINYGYQYTRGAIKFAFQYIGQVNQSGQSIPLQIIWNNLKIAPRPLLVGFPLLIIGIPGIGVILYYKFRSFSKRVIAQGKTSDIGAELPWDILIILIGWFVGVFFLYLTYEWTANSPGGAFFHFARFYLPGLFPVAVVSALFISRFSFKLYIPVLVILSAFGTMIYLQTAAHLNILPGWLINGGRKVLPPRPPGRFPGRPPLNGNPPAFPPGNLPGTK
jgi:hypothetical protein